MPDQIHSHDQPWMLAIDTSANQVGLALSSAADTNINRQSELSWPAARRQTETLLTEIDHLLRLCDIDATALGAVAVAIGPGSFNALRVGLSTAKALCFGLRIPIFGVGTLDAAAHAFRSFGYPVRAFIDAGRNRVVAGDYRIVEGQTILVSELVHYQRSKLANGLIEPTILAGRLSESDASDLRQLPNVIVPDEASRSPRPDSLIDIANRRWQVDRPDELFQLEPVYVHIRTGVTV